jgi:hypothetical protein
MKFFAHTALLIALLSLAVPALAQSVADIPNIHDWEQVDHTPPLAPNANFRQYSSTITTGGGNFVLGQSGCTGDHGVIIADQHTPQHNCYYRQFSGPVHLSWYGVPDVADPNNTACYTTGYPLSCDGTTQLQAALKAADVGAGLGGDGGVTTEGRSIAILSDNIEIKPDQYLTCEGPPGVSRIQSGLYPYYKLPHSIVLKFDNTASYTIQRDQNTWLSDCILRPSWYYPDGTLPPTTVAGTVQMLHKFVSTSTTCATKVCAATTCADKACNMESMLIIGFDTCDDTSQANKAIIRDVAEDCLVDEWLHNNGGGMKLQNLSASPVIETSLGDTAQSATATITAVALSGGDSVQVTVDTGSSTSLTDTFQASGGDTVLISGLGPGNTSTAPVSANGRWLTASATSGGGYSYNVVLTLPSWVGPTYSGSSWIGGAPVIKVYDTTNIIPGQYLCASGTAPFCTPPTGFGFSAATSSDIHSLGMTTGTVTISGGGTTSGWPVSGVVHVVSEDMLYNVRSGTTFKVTQRGVNGTSAVTHLNTDTITPAAPAVLGVVPSAEAVIVSAPAQSSGSGNVTFGNDIRVMGTLAGVLTLNPAYHTWTGNQGAGGYPSARLTVKANATGPTSTITSFAHCRAGRSTSTIRRCSQGSIVPAIRSPRGCAAR